VRKSLENYDEDFENPIEMNKEYGGNLEKDIL
jgi:hypothetical protein